MLTQQITNPLLKQSHKMFAKSHIRDTASKYCSLVRWQKNVTFLAYLQVHTYLRAICVEQTKFTGHPKHNVNIVGHGHVSI